MTERSQNSKLWLGLGVLLSLLMVVPTYLLVIAPHRTSTSTFESDTEAVAMQNTALASKAAVLREKNENRAELTAALATALSELPWETKLPEFSRQLTRHASKNGVDVTSISIGSASTPGQPAEEGVDPATTVRAIPVTVITTGTALEQLFFLRDVQQLGPRRALVNTTSLVPTDTGTIEEAATMTTQLVVFSAPVARETREQLRDILAEDGAA